MEGGYSKQEFHKNPEAVLTPMDFLLDQTVLRSSHFSESIWMQEYAKLARTQTDEFAFALVYYTDGTRRGIPLAR